MPIQVVKLTTDDVIVNIKRKLAGLNVHYSEVGPPESGPIVTRIPVTLDVATPIAKLMSKTEDLALACGVESVDIRREGRQLAVYIPNEEKKIVDFKDALFWYLQDEKVREMQLPILLGMSTKGDLAAFDLQKQPHLLISGSTGSGKSIFESNIIASLAMLKSTKELHIYLIDTKQLDLPLFSSLPHVKEVARTIEDYYSLITELNGIVEHTNKKLADVGARNIAEYNLQNPDKKIPHRLVIFDELADLLEKDRYLRTANGKAHIEPKALDSLRKLLQICRAAGVHVIACTQRTSGDIISGITKVNFPARIALKLPTKKDSEYILDEGGAENLLGNGDMLLKEFDADLPKRFHAPFVRQEDIKACLEGRELIRRSLGMED